MFSLCHVEHFAVRSIFQFFFFEEKSKEARKIHTLLIVPVISCPFSYYCRCLWSHSSIFEDAAF